MADSVLGPQPDFNRKSDAQPIVVDEMRKTSNAPQSDPVIAIFQTLQRIETKVDNLATSVDNFATQFERRFTEFEKRQQAR